MAKKATYKTGLQQEFVDEETGEIIRQTVTTEVVEGYRDVKLPDRAKLNNGRFITLFQEAMLTISGNANKSKMKREELIILIYLLGSAGIGNSVVLQQDEIVKATGIEQGNVSRALKLLKEKRIVLERSKYKNGRGKVDWEFQINFDQLNYNLAYNGKIKDFSKVKHTHPPLAINESISPNQLDIFGQLPTQL